MIATAHPSSSSAAGFARAPISRPLELLEARQLRDSLQSLLRREQSAMADFLVALADFDRRRGWEALGHASLFAFLIVELGLSTSSTYWRKSAAELLQGFPELERYVRKGQLCLTTMAELAKVLTQENKEAVLPRFLGISSRQAKEIVAELQPRVAPPLRDVVTSVAPAGPRPTLTLDFPCTASVAPINPGEGRPPRHDSGDTYSESFRAPEMEMTHPVRVAAKREEVEPLTAGLSRLHFNVRRQFVKKLEAARDGLSHAIPGATMEQVLEAALDLLLEKQARARGLVKRPRKFVTTPSPGPIAASTAAQAHPPAPPSALTLSATSPAIPASTSPRPTAPDPAPPLDLFPAEPPPHRRQGPREHVSAAVRRAVWARDGERCSWPLDGGGVCGSTHRLELDHVNPWARWGGETAGDLRVVCHAHNALAARQAFGTRCMGRYARRRS